MPMWKGGVCGRGDGGVFPVWVPDDGCLREPFYEEDERLRGAVKAAEFRASVVAIKYMLS